MNVSLNWLRELVPGLEGSAKELAERFSMAAAAVETLEPVGQGLADIVVAHVLEAEPHPDADRLTFCRIDCGAEEPVELVCGAPVVEVGALYPYVAPGVELPGGLRIESRTIRGVMSHGMLCSEYELELGRDKSGIMRLPDGLEVGQALTEVLGLPDVRLTLDLNPNRVDLACHVGVARELAPRGEADLVLRELGVRWEPRWNDGAECASAAGVTVRIEATERCPRYLGAIVRGVAVGPSPAWLAGRLLAIGARPINNVVDATNYVLFELNQPIHAFDLSTLGGSEIRVRAGQRGERLRTLDGENRDLGPGVTVIADRDRAVALAGVMGGEETEVTPATVDLLIECAAFTPRAVRDTVRALTLPTDASYRFERGIDESGPERALTRCVELIVSSAGGEAETEAIWAGRLAPEPPVVRLRTGRIHQVLGLRLSDREVTDLLLPIGFDPAGSPGPAGSGAEATADPQGDGASLHFEVPGWRNDVRREIDLVEEVARRYGYQRFPDEERRFRPSAVPNDPAWDRMDRVRALLAGEGLLEARSSSFVPKDQPGGRAEVGVLHPLSAEEGFLRATMVPVLLRRAEYNFARGRRDVRLFEIGTVFHAAADAGSGSAADQPADGTEAYQEELRVGLVVTGSAAPRHWSGATRDVDLWDVKGLATDVAEQLCGARVEPLGEDPGVLGRFGGGWLGDERFRIVRDDRTLGIAGNVGPEAVDAPRWAGSLWGVEFELDSVQLGELRRYEPISAFPAVRRDLAVVLSASVATSDVEASIRAAAAELLESVELFDVYEGEGVESGHRSLGWAFRFRAADRTLTDQDVDTAMKSIIASLEEAFDARIRAS